MEVEHEEQVIGFEQKSQSQKVLSPTSSSESLDDTNTININNNNYYNIEYFVTTRNTSSTVTINSNGEKHNVFEEQNPTKFDTLAQFQAEVVEPTTENDTTNNSASNPGSNGFSVHQNGSNVVHYHVESNGGGKELDGRSNCSSSSKSPDTAVGLKFVESLFDASSSDASSEIYNAERNTVNGTLTVSGEKKKVGKQLSKEAEPEEEEFDVEGVIQKQETHDLYCPNCHSCITKRVILRRRKRKIGEISKGDEASESGLDQNGSIVDSGHIAEETQQPLQVGETPGACFDAISCFSCFSLFIPSGEGFLCWRFKPKQDVPQQRGGTMTSPEQVTVPVAEESRPEGNFFPLWIVTCCQPADRPNPEPTLESNYQRPSTNDTEAQPEHTDRPLSPSDDTPLSSEPNANSDQSTDTPVPHKSNLVTSQNMPLKPIEHEYDIPSSETPVVTPPEAGKSFPMWFLTCCQPSADGSKHAHTEMPAEGILSGHTKPSASSDGKKPTSEPSGKMVTTPESNPPYNTSDDSDAPTAPSDEIPESPRPATPAVPTHEPPVLLPKPASPKYPDGGTSSAQPSVTRARGEVTVEMPEELHKPQPDPVMPLPAHGEGPLHNLETPLLLNERPRPGVSVVDIIKAIVYGGLLECITSLSVITSAAGGDATTLNIVALGLANVIGGLLVLVHNLRVLKNEHTTEHYEAQLGRPGHHLLHAIVAIISYLIFGLMSPVIYGFSFRKSDNKDYKLATLAAASLLCITVLSTAKAYVRNPPKAYIKTVFYYISLGFIVSGLGYVAGDLINMGLKKLGVFDQKAPVDGAWLSY